MIRLTIKNIVFNINITDSVDIIQKSRVYSMYCAKLTHIYRRLGAKGSYLPL